MTDLLARIREHEKSLAANTTKVFDLPRREGFVGARFQCLDPDGLERTVDALQADDHEHATVDYHAALLVEACKEIVFYDENGKVVPQKDDLGPIRFDQRFAKLIGLEVDPNAEPEEVVKAVFTEEGRLNAQLLSGYGRTVDMWLAGVRREQEENLA